MNKDQIRAIVLGVLVVGLMGNAAAFLKPKPMPAKPPVAIEAGKTYTLDQVALHKTGLDCWSAVNGGIYDLTSWIARHPGGEGAILSICGQDGSDAFNSQHGNQGRPEKILETFKIGQLK